MTAIRLKLSSAILLAVFALPVGLAAQQDASAFFKQSCTSCHSIGGGRLVGPDLKNVTQRKSREWLGHFIQNPQAVIDSGDPYAKELLGQSNGIVMPRIPGVTPAMASALLDFIESESKPAPPPVASAANRPLAAHTVSAYFGQNCASCHTVGGGRLGGPDLKNVSERRDHAWLVRFIQAPAAVVASGDSYAIRLVRDYEGAVMPKPADITPAMATALVEMLAPANQQPQSQAVAASSTANAEQTAAPSVPASAPNPEAEAFFEKNCTVCHSVGQGRLVGPDLKNVTDRKDHEWLAHFIMDPKKVIDSGDPYAAQLMKESGGIVMPTVPGVTPALAGELLQLIDFRSGKAGGQAAQAAPPPQPEIPFTPEDVSRGRRLFLGEERLKAGGPPCISCHTVTDIGGLGGGRLGPDLTRVHERLNGRKGLSAWLRNPASPTMQPVFAKQPLDAAEIHALAAYFDDSTRMREQPVTTARLRFLLIGLGGMALGLVALNITWRRRLHGVRRSMVHKNGTRNGGRS